MKIRKSKEVEGDSENQNIKNDYGVKQITTEDVREELSLMSGFQDFIRQRNGSHITDY